MRIKKLSPNLRWKKEVYCQMSSLRILHLAHCPMTTLPRQIFKCLNKLENIFADNYKPWCPATQPSGFLLMTICCTPVGIVLDSPSLPRWLYSEIPEVRFTLWFLTKPPATSGTIVIILRSSNSSSTISNTSHMIGHFINKIMSLSTFGLSL